MDPKYFSDSLGYLSETLKPYTDEKVSVKLVSLINKLKLENPNLWVQRYSVLDETAKPHCVAFDFEVDIILYLHYSCNFSSTETLINVREILLTWDISDFEQIHSGFQFSFLGVTVNLLVARDMTSSVSSHSQENEHLISSDTDDAMSDVRSAGSEVVFEESHSKRASSVTTEDSYDEGLTVYRNRNVQHLENELEREHHNLVKKQCELVIGHIEDQTGGMSDASDRMFVVDKLGKRYTSSLIESYHGFFSSRTPFCISFIRICKFWCLKVFLNKVHFGLLRYVESLAVYICSRKEQAYDYYVLLTDFLMALKSYNSIRIDFAYYYTENKRSECKRGQFNTPFITDVSFPYSNILDDVPVRDFDILADAAEYFLKVMRKARSFSALFSVQPYPRWLIDRLEPFYFIFQPSETMSIQISIHSSKKDLIPDDFLPGLSSRLYLWRQSAIADTRKHQAKESGCFHRAVSGLVIIDFKKGVEAEEVVVSDNVILNARHKIVISFPDYSHEVQIFKCNGKRRTSLFLSLLCGGTCSAPNRSSSSDSEYMTELHEVEMSIASPFTPSESEFNSSFGMVSNSKLRNYSDISSSPVYQNEYSK